MAEVSHTMATNIATSHDAVFRLPFVGICGSVCLPTSCYMVHKKDEISLLTASKGLE